MCSREVLCEAYLPAGDPFGGSVECEWIPEAATPDDVYAASEILKALDRIPAKFSVVLALHFFDGFDAIELGELLHGREKKRLGRERGSGAAARSGSHRWSLA